MEQDKFQDLMINGMNDLCQRQTNLENIVTKHLVNNESKVNRLGRSNKILQFIVVPALSGGVLTAIITKFI